MKAIVNGIEVDLGKFEWTKSFHDRYASKVVNPKWYTTVTVSAEDSGSNPAG